VQNYEIIWNSVLILCPGFIKIHAMLKRIFTFFIVFTSGFLFFGCGRSSVPSKSSATSEPAVKGQSLPGPPCIIYKTKADYYHLVPVILSKDRSHITSFPGIRDIYYKGHLAYPDSLVGGFLLDNRGIGPDVAFLSYTYEAYGKLETSPGSTELWKNILDKDPLLEMYQCGNKNQYDRPKDTMNEIIAKDWLKECIRLK